MKLFSVCLGIMLALAPAARAMDFSKWAVVIVAGDDHSHSGAHSEVFDNARKDLARAFTGIGFAPANMAQFSVDFDYNAQHTSTGTIANTLWDLSSRAPDGCLIYFTSHGTPSGIIVDGGVLPPEKMAAMVNNACGDKPSVIVMSACFSGQFVPALAGDNRIVLTAARPDRTSFGCGDNDHYTFFDECFLQTVPRADDFAGLGTLVQRCVALREQQMNATPPSEPQLAVGPKVAFTLRWR